jgi:four helix bundle protein
MTRQEMPIFSRTFDFLEWLLKKSNSFPKTHRFTLTQRLLNSAFNLSEALHTANALRGAQRKAALQQADIALNQLRHYLRLTHRLGWLNMGAYQHAASMVDEIGRLLGGWLKTVT